METVYDWLTMAIFAVLVVIFLQRSVGPRPDNDRIINYLPPAVACAGANYLGNHDWMMPALALMVASMAYIWFVLKPLGHHGKP